MSPPKPPSPTLHPIQVAARRSGLTADVIRAWERRYGAVRPTRTETNRRLYSDEDVERLLLLHKVTRAGRRIGDVATLSLEDLRSMVAADQEAWAQVGPAAGRPPRGTDAALHLAACLEAVRELDAEALEAALRRAAVDLSVPVLTEQVLVPLMQTIGDQWHQGSLRVAHEHMATALVRSFLGTLRNGQPEATEGCPEIIVATPAGQRHELGALMAAVAASSDGWRVTYLGADLPAEDIAAATARRAPRAVGLSVVYPADDPRLAGELRRLREALGDRVTLLVGGASAEAYAETLRDIGARLVPDMMTLREELRTLRQAQPSG
jgi:methanogenic corrinoid protein MtbC1